MPAAATLAAAAGFCLVMYAGQVPVLAPLGGRTTWARAGNLGFSYPAEWQRVGAPLSGSFVWMTAAVSNQALEQPCTKSVGPASTTVTCGPPIDRLVAGGLLVEWWQDGFPGFRFDSVPGYPATVDGRPVKISEEDGALQECSGTGAARTIRAVIPRAPDNYFVFAACLGSRDGEDQRQAALRILRSAQIYEQWQTP